MKTVSLAVALALAIVCSASIANAAGAPDLTATQAVFQGTVVQIKVTNIGTAVTPAGVPITVESTPPAGVSATSWTIDGSGSCAFNGSGGVVCNLMPQMMPRAVTTIYVRLNGPASGSVASVDPLNRIAESNEANNVSVAP